MNDENWNQQIYNIICNLKKYIVKDLKKTQHLQKFVSFFLVETDLLQMIMELIKIKIILSISGKSEFFINFVVLKVKYMHYEKVKYPVFCGPGGCIGYILL